MLLEKPDQVQHLNASGTVCAIYAIDAHPSKKLFATAGGDSSVKIWSFEKHPQAQMTEQQQQQFHASDQLTDDEQDDEFELIATLTEHQQAVNCVRWAGHGRYLASGSDDQLVLLYELQEGKAAPVPFGSNAKPNKQNWVRCSTLKRHTMDVEDVSWSPDDRMLATCSIDNSILIWDVDSSSLTSVVTQPLHVLSGHNGWVKGVTWDPVGKYLASAGDDKCVKVWRVDSWQTAQTITKPFESCASSSHFRRLSWSPDGSALCATHAFCSKQDVAALLDRQSWNNEVNFVGHRGLVTSCRFNSRLLVKNAEASSSSSAPSQNEFACCAVGGDDATVSVWLAQVSRPLAVIKDCFDAGVTDLCWSSCGYWLFACSLDGSICCFQFSQREIGRPISHEKQSRLLQTKYGARAGITLASTLAENPLQLKLEERMATKRAKVPSASSTVTSALPTAEAGAPRVNVLVPVSKKSSDKKRRITPMLASSSAGASSSMSSSEVLLQQSASNGVERQPADQRIEFSSSTSPIKKIPGKKQDLMSKVDARLSNKQQQGDHAPTKTPHSSVTNGSPTKPAKKAANGLLKRKRDALATSPQQRRSVPSSASASTAREVFVRPPKQLSLSTTRDPALGAGQDNESPILPEFPFRLSFSVEIQTAKRPNSSTTRRVGDDMGLRSDSSRFTLLEISVQNIKTTSDDELIETGPVYSTIKCTENGLVKWIDRVPGRATCAVGNELFCAVGMADGSLFIFSSSGRRLFPPMVVGGFFAVLECSHGSSPFLLVVFSSGVVKIWNVLARAQLLCDSIEAIAMSGFKEENPRRATLLKTQISAKGQPIFTFAFASNGASTLESFSFDFPMKAWLRVCDDSFVYSDFNSTLFTEAVVPRHIPLGSLRRLQNASGFLRTQKHTPSFLLTDMNDAILQRNLTRSHLEHQIVACLALQSSVEYEYWLKSYVRFLAMDEDVLRLEELCAEMIGPFHASSTSPLALVQPNNEGPTSTSSSPLWTPWVFNHKRLNKRTLLRDVILPIVASQRTLQRVVNKYQLMLHDIEQRESDEKQEHAQERNAEARSSNQIAAQPQAENGSVCADAQVHETISKQQHEQEAQE